MSGRRRAGVVGGQGHQHLRIFLRHVVGQRQHLRRAQSPRVVQRHLGLAPTGVRPAGQQAAEGTGGGTMLYEVASQTLLSNEAGMLMKMTLDAADGVIEVEMNTKQSQTTRPTTPAGQ